jgi:DNA-binding XRE family transcriptional regulator
MTTKELRQALAATNKKATIAQKAGVSRQYIYALASGVRQEPSHSVALRIIKALKEIEE